MKKINLEYTKIKFSKIHGKGIYSTKDIKKGSKIIEYLGEKITKKEANKRAYATMEKHYKNPLYNGAVYIFELNKKYDLDGDISGNSAKYINHSCGPNCRFKIADNRIWIIAKRNIKKGEELSYNYGYDMVNFAEHQCYCRSKKCVGYILDKKYWKKIKNK